MVTRFAWLLLVPVLLAGCSSGDEPEVRVRTAAATAPAVDNDLARNSAHRTLKIPGENFTLTVDYFLTSYDATKWQTLTGKDVNLAAYVKPTGARAVPEVVLGSFEARTTLRAVDPGLDGFAVTVFRDVPPTAVRGYSMTSAYPYSAVVAVEGFSTALAERWRFLAGDQELTEPALVTAGVYANRLTFTYGLLVRDAGGTGYHKRSVTDSLTVPVATG
jgi:hypothetical protein